MKNRNGFVSNSSSSSFIIDRANLSDVQIDMIKNHIAVAKKGYYTWKREIEECRENGIATSVPNCDYDELLNDCDNSDRWDITVTDDAVEGKTFMDNFDMRWFLVNMVKVDEKVITWSEW